MKRRSEGVGVEFMDIAECLSRLSFVLCQMTRSCDNVIIC